MAAARGGVEGAGGEGIIPSVETCLQQNRQGHTEQLGPQRRQETPTMLARIKVAEKKKKKKKGASGTATYMSETRVELRLRVQLPVSYEQLLRTVPPTSSAAPPLVSFSLASRSLFIQSTHQHWTQ